MALPYTPIFGQVHAGALECPHCGTVHVFGKARKHWRPVSQSVKCKTCSVRIYLGLLVWTGTKGPSVPPPTSIASTPAALRGLRNHEGGFWVHLGRKNSDPASLYPGPDAYCTCVDPIVDRSCRQHGRQYEAAEPGEQLADHLPSREEDAEDE